MKNKGLVVGMGSLTLAVLYYIWPGEGWWKAGFGLINGLFLILILVIYRKELKGNLFWWTAWWGSIILGGFLGLRSNEFVSLVNVAAVIVINIMLAGLASNKQEDFGFNVVIYTLLGFLGNMVRSLWEIVSKLKKLMPQRLGNWQKVIIGIIISLPLLVVFGGLFLAADPIFAKLVAQINIPELRWDKIFNFRNISTVVFLGAVGAALKQKLAEDNSIFRPWKHVSEIFIATTILQGLFLIFAAVQIRYFGVNAETLRGMGITFSQYTRQGYAQMIISCLLAWGIVYGLDFVMRSQRETGGGRIWGTRLLGYAFMGEILLFIAAATKRNWLYQSAYGFTEARLLGFWLSLWLIFIVVITFLKFWQNKNEDFLVRRIMITSIVVLIGLNIFNIDRTVAVMKPAKLAQGTDYEYMAGLSNDAWEGFEEILADVEKRINNNEINSYDEAVRLNSIVSRLEYKKTQLEQQSKNNWQWGGAANYSDIKTWELLTKNNDRIKIIDNKLSAIRDRWMETDKIKAEEKLPR